MTDTDSRGKLGRLTDDEVAAFLSEPHFARIACLDEKGWPYVVPAWHQWTGDTFLVVAREKSRWARYLARDPRCAVTVDEDHSRRTEQRGQRRVVAQCIATIEEQPNTGGAWVAIAEEMSNRYLGENGPKYLEPTLDRPRWLIALRPTAVQTWQGSDWARAYR